MYATDYEHARVLVGPPGGPYKTLAQVPRIYWMDTMSVADNGYLYFTANELQRQPSYHNGKDLRIKPYRLYRVKVGAKPVLAEIETYFGKRKQSSMASDTTTNISSQERWSTTVLGGGLATYGLLRRTPASLALGAAGLYLIYRGSTGYCPAYAAAGINPANPADSQEAVRAKLGDVGIKVTHAVTINKPPPSFTPSGATFRICRTSWTISKSVTVQDGGKSHWVAKAPLGKTVAWDAEIINEVPTS